MAPASITIILELDETLDSPVGSARLPNGTSRRFHGWLGLAESINALADMYVRSGAETTRASRHAEQELIERSSTS